MADFSRGPRAPRETTPEARPRRRGWALRTVPDPRRPSRHRALGPEGQTRRSLLARTAGRRTRAPIVPDRGRVTLRAAFSPPSRRSRPSPRASALVPDRAAPPAAREGPHDNVADRGPAESDRATRQALPFASRRFHVLFNSLFKVLFNFPSRYLFAIGLVTVFSLRWSLPPALGCIPKQPDSGKTP